MSIWLATGDRGIDMQMVKSAVMTRNSMVNSVWVVLRGMQGTQKSFHKIRGRIGVNLVDMGWDAQEVGR